MENEMGPDVEQLDVKNDAVAPSLLNARLAAVISSLPTTWLDSFLTGPDAVIGKPPYNCPDIERLLIAIKNRAVKAANVKLTRPPTTAGTTKG